MNDSETHILWRIICEWWPSYCKIPGEKRQWTVLGSSDRKRREWKAHRNISETELMVFDDFSETLGIIVFSGIYCVNLAIHLLTITEIVNT